MINVAYIINVFNYKIYVVKFHILLKERKKPKL